MQQKRLEEKRKLQEEHNKEINDIKNKNKKELEEQKNFIEIIKIKRRT